MKRFADLTAEETGDLWLTAQKIGKRLEHHHKASSLTFTIQVRWLQLTFQNVRLFAVSWICCLEDVVFPPELIFPRLGC